MTRPIILIGLALFPALIFSCYAANTEIPDPFPELAQSYLVEIQGEIIWSQRPDLRLAPASLTKIMTALLVLKKARMDDVVAVGKKAAGESGAHLGLQKGDHLHVMDLLAATLIFSANDACHALADQVGGNESAFVTQMNHEASVLGMNNTHFVNACGHDHPEHYSTARDLALLSEAALKSEIFRALVGKVEMRIQTVDHKKSFYFQNRNELIGRYPTAIGIKTGTTPRAGKCLIALTEKNGARVLLVMLNAKERWWSAVNVLDRAFAQARYLDESKGAY